MKVIFLDRDGVINKEVGYLYKIDAFEFTEGIFQVCQHFQACGYALVIITNQSGIARGYYQIKDFHILTKWMLERFSNQGIRILDVLFCPHGEKSKCACRKPKPGMLIKAHKKFNINMKNSWLIGDKEIDIQAANAAGVKNTILLRSEHINEKNSNATFVLKSIKDSINYVL